MDLDLRIESYTKQFFTFRIPDVDIGVGNGYHYLTVYTKHKNEEWLTHISAKPKGDFWKSWNVDSMLLSYLDDAMIKVFAYELREHLEKNKHKWD